MKISIAERLHPFSHDNGTKFLIPGTSICVQVFPTRLNFTDLDGKQEPFSLTFDFVGPLKDFTAELDLEKSLLRVFGMTKEGFMRYVIAAKKGGIELAWEKSPGKRENVWIPLPIEPKAKNEERLSLGMHKAQDWTLVCRRFDMKEIFPVLFALGRSVVSSAPCGNEGNYRLLEECRLCNRQNILESFETFIKASFEGVLVPRLQDTDHQGILSLQQINGHSPLPLLMEGSNLVRSLFIQEREEGIAILPCLPVQFHSGRMVGINAGSVRIDIEWTKKALRHMRVGSTKGGEVTLILPKGFTSCRVGKKKHMISNHLLTLSLRPNQTLDLDRFS